MSKKVFRYKWIVSTDGGSINGAGALTRHTYCIQLEGDAEPVHVTVTSSGMGSGDDALRSYLHRHSASDGKPCTCGRLRTRSIAIPA